MAPGTEPITAAARRRTVVVAGHAGHEPAARAALDDMCKRPSFRPADLAGDLNEETKLALARHLHKEGFLILCE